MQAILESGFLADIRDANIGEVDRDSLRKIFGLTPLNENTDNVYHRYISDKPLIIKATDGKRTISKAKDVFDGWIDPDFKNWGTDKAGSATGETSVAVYEMIKDGKFRQLFNSLGSCEDLCLTQDQVISFVENHSNWLRTDGYGTFFLFQSNGEYFVADVHVYSDGLDVLVGRFGDSIVWDADGRRRVVVPQLTT